MQRLKSTLSASLLAASFVFCTLAVAKPTEALPPLKGCLDTSQTNCKVFNLGGDLNFEGQVITIQVR